MIRYLYRHRFYKDSLRGTTYGTTDGLGRPSVAAILGPGGPILGGTVSGMTDSVVENIMCEEYRIHFVGATPLNH